MNFEHTKRAALRLKKGNDGYQDLFQNDMVSGRVGRREDGMPHLKLNFNQDMLTEAIMEHIRNMPQQHKVGSTTPVTQGIWKRTAPAEGTKLPEVKYKSTSLANKLAGIGFANPMKALKPTMGAMSKPMAPMAPKPMMTKGMAQVAPPLNAAAQKGMAPVLNPSYLQGMDPQYLNDRAEFIRRQASFSY